MSSGSAGETQFESSTSIQKLTPEDMKDDAALASYLVKAGINPGLYGVEKAKPISALRKEVLKGESCLEWCADTSTILRVVEPIFVQFRWKDRVLVEVEQVFKDGRTRRRNMLLAEKRAPEDQGVAEAAVRGLCEELNLPEDFPKAESLRFMHEAYCCICEKLESASYPGLPCTYITHYCSVQLLDAGLPHFDKLGMLMDSFDSEEPDKVNRWRWTAMEQARASKVKGFPEVKTPEVSNITSWLPLKVPPEDLVGLRIALEVGGVNVETWGEYTQESLSSLARELSTGLSRLEQDADSGKVRRVIKSRLVQLMVGEGESNAEKSSADHIHIPGSTTGDGSLVPISQSGALNMEQARSMVHFNSNMGVFELEHVDITSYPGLPCCHQTRQLQFKQRDESEQVEPKSNQDVAASKDAVPAEPGSLELPALMNAAKAASFTERPASPDISTSCPCHGLLSRPFSFR